jgi:polysaccharide export outer membrane protein
MLHMLGFLKVLASITMIWLLASCGNLKQLQYLQGTIDTAALNSINFVEPKIQQGDLISITVYSDNQAASAIYNQGGAVSPTLSGGGMGGTIMTGTGYLVTETGHIQLYELGSIMAAGLTKKQLGDLLAQQYAQKNLLNNPFVEVRFLNFKITVVGDVNRPGVYTFPVEKVSVFDAIGMAGDLTAYAKRDNILVVREVNGVRRFARLDLTNPEVFNSSYYYLQQNDMIVIDPTKAKTTLTDQTLRNISIATSLLSIIAITYSLFRN